MKLKDTPCANPKDFLKLGLARDDEEREDMKGANYMELLGKLMWINRSRPDTTYYTSVLVRYMQGTIVWRTHQKVRRRLMSV